MNYKQKLGYMALGAGILVVGIMIGHLVTPDIEAQSNGVFDEINCRKLTATDNEGHAAIGLVGDTFVNSVYILDRSGNEAISLLHLPKSGQNSIYVSDLADRTSFEFNAYPERHELIVYEKSSAAGIGFYSDSNEAKQITWTHD